LSQIGDEFTRYFLSDVPCSVDFTFSTCEIGYVGALLTSCISSNSITNSETGQTHTKGEDAKSPVYRAQLKPYDSGITRESNMAIYLQLYNVLNRNSTLDVLLQAIVGIAAPRFLITQPACQVNVMRPDQPLRFARKLFCRGHKHPVCGAQLGNEHGTRN
jgi:hypothetical protein